MEATIETNVVVVLQTVAKLELKTYCPEDNSLCGDEVIIKMLKVCICGIDDHCVFEGEVGHMKMSMPCGVCQACMGEVVECGCDVTDLKIGDRVTIEPGSPCCCCNMCKSGCYNLCEESNYYTNDDINGGCLAKYCKSKAHLVHKLPDCICDEDGAMVYPLAVALHACQKGDVFAGCNVLITGSGLLGLLCLSVAKAMGATNVIVIGKHESRLKMAEEMGADHTLLVDCDEDADLIAQKVKEEMDCSPEISIECSGTETGMAVCIYATEACGKIVQVGICNKDVTLPLCYATMREIDIIGICGSVNCFPRAIDMIANDLVCVNKLISKCYEMEDCQEAFDYYHNNYECYCCMLNCN